MPVVVACAEADPHFPLPFVEASATLLEGMNATLTKQTYPGNAHTVFPQEITCINQQLTQLRA
jgi:phospholipase/carboxylesterase